MAKKYCPYSNVESGFLSETNYCNSPGHKDYEKERYIRSECYEISYDYAQKNCNTEKCFQCVNYHNKSSNNSNGVFCSNCGDKVPNGNFCKSCGSRL